MHLNTLLAFAFVFWQAEQPPGWLPAGKWGAGWTLLIVLLQPPLLGVLAALAGRRARRLFTRQPDAPHAAHYFHHRATFVLRSAALCGFGVAVFLTPWPNWFSYGSAYPALHVVGDVIVLVPFVLSHVAIWLGAYPFERVLRAQNVGWPEKAEQNDKPHWGLGTYLDFNLRHNVLVVAAPMTLVLLAANVTRGYEASLQAWGWWAWTPDVVLGASVAGVFLLSPLMLCRIWRTRPLEAGQLRSRLEAICSRIGLRCRNILVWESDGMMINAAVMGLFAPVRYVLLSDGLLASMNERQVEAVFGHEAGHVRRRHIQQLLVFALVGWLFVAGLMELLARSSLASGPSALLSPVRIQAVGILATLVFWGLGFGWISRRLEREADLFGAECVSPDSGECALPCSVHSGDATHKAGDGRVCATGAAIFTSALDCVAVLNGIPHEERSWRHSSIGSRIRFLTSLANDPNRAHRFRRLLRRIKVFLLASAVIGLGVSLYYVATVLPPAALRLQLGVH